MENIPYLFLISQDLLNLFDKFVPKFVEQYLDLSPIIEEAFKQYKEDVEKGSSRMALIVFQQKMKNLAN